MPTYEYACQSCGEHLEVSQSFTDDPLTTCPHCGGTLRKVFGSIGIVLKGSGFYKTDSRSAGKAGSGKSKDAGESATAAPKAAEGSGASGGGSKDSGSGSSSSSDSSSSSGGSAPAKAAASS